MFTYTYVYIYIILFFSGLNVNQKTFIGGYRIYGLSILSHETGHDLRERTTNIHLSPTDYVTEYHFVCKEKKTEKVLKQIAINYFQYYYQLTHAVSEVA